MQTAITKSGRRQPKSHQWQTPIHPGHLLRAATRFRCSGHAQNCNSGIGKSHFGDSQWCSCCISDIQVKRTDLRWEMTSLIEIGNDSEPARLTTFSSCLTFFDESIGKSSGKLCSSSGILGVSWWLPLIPVDAVLNAVRLRCRDLTFSGLCEGRIKPCEATMKRRRWSFLFLNRRDVDSLG